MAAELADRGFKVNLVDVSASLGRWAPEDWEGPFGFFYSEHLTPTQVARLSEEDYFDSVDQGFSVCLEDGPLDTKGPLSSHWLSHNPAMVLLRRHLNHWTDHNPKAMLKLREQASLLPFEQNWFAHLAHQMASHVFLENAESLTYGRPLPLFAPLFIRRVSRRGYAKSLEWCESKGVDVHSGATLVDISIEGKLCTGVEIRSGWSGVLQSPQVVWMLSSLETERLSSNISQRLFPKGVAQPEWAWMRYRLQMDLGVYEATLPLHFALIQDKALPWSHDNLLIIQKSVSLKDYDIWARIPIHHRFQRSYLEEFGQKILSHMQEKLPILSVKIADMPQDYMYDYAELGPSLFPVYSRQGLEQLQTLSLKNIYYDGPERTTTLDWTGRFLQNQMVLNKIMAWKESQERRQQNSRGKVDKQVHAP